MLWFGIRKKVENFEQKIESSFSSVKKDMVGVGKWIKHLDQRDKQLFDLINQIQGDLSSIKDDLVGLKEGFEMAQETKKDKQVFKKLPVLDKKTGVLDVQEAVQTAVQTGNFYDILKTLSSNERLIVFTLLNSEMKLSYEDLALLLGKERATIRGQINAIKQKREGLVEEIVEKNGKKRVYIPLEIKQKLQKYVKVRVKNKRES